MNPQREATLVIPSTLRVESQIELPFTPDLVVVPGIAFSRNNRRLRLGVCYRIQLRDTIPIDGPDILLDAVITD